MKSLLWKLMPRHWRHANSGRQRLQVMPEKRRGLRAAVPLTSYPRLLSLYSFLSPNGAITLRTKVVPTPLTLRYGTSDREVFEQVFVEKQYEFPQLKDVRYIIDAGANIGLASAYLLAKYPNARVIAIEPDPDNFEIAARNLSSFGDRCQLVRGAIWSSQCNLAMQRSELGHWATYVTELDGSPSVSTAKLTEPTDVSAIAGYTIEQIMKEFGLHHIDLLKVDIEGAELPLFRDGDTSFLQKTRCCAVECHDDVSLNAFLAACNPDRFEITEQCELTVATLRTPVSTFTK